ncbi:hemolymph lipopolysaccharide-binding protein [Anabrus simplex]|uniref:hemolymph lipopolysaccharide-binding protein n=1 Tax=Anabrus simplex TaxID=316456 RepID=UPI0035A26842
MNMNLGLVILCLQLLVIKIKSTEIENKIPEGYRKYRDLGFYKLHTTYATWNVARQTCENENAYLVIINSEEELKVIGDMMDAEMAAGVHAGFDDLVTEGEYYTIYGEPLSSTYVKWASGEPDNANGDEDCGNIEKNGDDLGLNDMGCESTRFFICELKDS